tara:strand:+ start:605 stop:1216 length:612 start_codon:yes stop_codon:yes gene_type:complete
MKFVCVTQRIVYDKNTKTYKDALDQELVNFLTKIGYKIIPIPNIESSNKEILNLLKFYRRRFKVNGFIFSGGEDILKNKKRYKIEKLLYSFCLKEKVPLFGICRGLQMISHLNNIQLIKVSGHVAKRHKILNLVNNKKKIVNSFHNWKIKECPKNFQLTDISEDNVIEGIKHRILPIHAVMWHPEREKIYYKSDILIFQKLFK